MTMRTSLKSSEHLAVEPFEETNVEICHVALATPPNCYQQSELPEYFSLKNPTVKKFFGYSHIQSRYLYLPPRDLKTGFPVEEPYGDLLKKFEKGALEMGQKALLESLEKASLTLKEIDFLCCVTSTGFTVPGLTALFLRELGLRNDCQRLDVVGMGCNAGLNGLNAVASWSAVNPGKNAVLLCVEVCSAMYTIDDTPRTGIVNSLFGDGAIACVVKNSPASVKKNRESSGNVFSLSTGLQAKILGFESQVIPEFWRELRFDWDENKKRYSFYVGKDTPQAIAQVAHLPFERLIERFKLSKKDIGHWVIHGGGNAILVGMQEKLQLTDHDVRHTRSVLRDYGNVSSGSFLFSYKRLMEEGAVRARDLGIMATMGPGLCIEMALIRWS